MPDITASNSAVIKVDNAATWNTARQSSSGTASEPTNLSLKIATAIGPYDIHRTFIVFDTSSITVTPTSATLKLTAPSTGAKQNNYIVLKGSSTTTGSTTAEYVNGDFGKGEFPFVAFSAIQQASSWSNGSVNEITLNATARQAMADLDEFRIVIIAEQDYNNDDTATSTKSGPGFRSAAYGTVADRPKVSYVAGSASESETPKEKRNKRRRRRSKGARGKGGFAVKDVIASSGGGSSTGNGFSDI